MTKNLAEYFLDDFLMDEDFIQWVYNDRQDQNNKWNKYISQFPEKKQVVEEASMLLLSLKFEKHEMSFGKKINLSKNIQKSLEVDESVTSNPGWGRSLFKYAASAIIILGLAFIGYNAFIQKEEMVAVKNVVKKNIAGQKSTITLPDGSTVKLNAESTLTYGVSFNNEIREVNLEGEAFFMVVKNEQAPFTVNTGDVKATVLGTSFNVRNFSEEIDIQIALATGSLRVEGNNQNGNQSKLVLVPNEMTSYTKSSGEMIKSNFDPEEVLAWKNNTIYFNQANLTEVERKLERWFGVNIVLANQPITPVSLSTTFTNQSLENTLETLKFTLGFEYEFLEDKVNIQFKR
jgi:transmembrane sensor